MVKGYGSERTAPGVGHGLVESLGGVTIGGPLVATVTSAEHLDGGVPLRAGEGDGILFPSTPLDNGATVARERIGLRGVGLSGTSGEGQGGGDSQKSGFDHDERN